MRADRPQRPLLSIEMTPETPQDAERLRQGLKALTAEDPTLTADASPDGDTVVIGAMGEQHLEIVIDRLAREFGVSALVGHPQLVLDNGLEPVMWIEINVPDEYSRPVVEDLMRRHARIEIDEVRGGTRVVAAIAPLVELLGYATDLRTRTRGRGAFTMAFFGYDSPRLT
jgi:translation elongation factor EF-G